MIFAREWSRLHQSINKVKNSVNAKNIRSHRTRNYYWLNVLSNHYMLGVLMQIKEVKKPHTFIVQSVVISPFLSYRIKIITQKLQSTWQVVSVRREINAARDTYSSIVLLAGKLALSALWPLSVHKPTHTDSLQLWLIRAVCTARYTFTYTNTQGMLHYSRANKK